MLPGELPAADRHYAEMLRLSALALSLVRRAWNTVDANNIADSWDRSLARILTDFTRLQFDAAASGTAMVGGALAEQRIQSTPDARFLPESLVGWASDGRPLESLLATPARVALDAIDLGKTPEEALAVGRASVERIARTQVTDAGRVASGVEVAIRPRLGWVRMLTPPSCERCLILAGRFYRWSDGFDRHPNDDCVSIPAVEERAGDLRTNPDAYLRRLSTEEQDRLLGKANAQAWRDGADLNQLVNAKRGMSTTADGVRVTVEGATTRGLAGQRLRAQSSRVATRLVPESIYRLATDRVDALRLLHQHGYIVANPTRTGLSRRQDRDRPRVGQAALDAAPLDRNSDQLSFEHRSEIRQYKGVAYDPTNTYLRQGSGSFFRETVEEMDAALDQSRLAADVTVYRGIQNPRAVLGERFDGDLTGMEWIEHAYLSTSADRSIAEGFAKDSGLIMRILVRRGAPMIKLSDLAPEGIDPGPLHEAELLGGRGWRLRVVADHGVDEQGRRRVDVEVTRHDRSGTNPWNRPSP